MSRSPSSEKVETTSALTTTIAIAGLDERVEPVAPADGDDPGQAAQEDVGGDLERVAVDRAAEHARSRP